MTTNNYFITIAGNIGVGKSTLVHLLSDKLSWQPIFEAVEENPYLADFYADMPRWAFQSQVFFLSKRLQQHHNLLQHRGSVIQDRSVYEDAEIFARNLYMQKALSERDWACYYDLYQTMASMLRPPHLMVYLKASVPTLRRRITQRGRDYEQSITDQYLSQLNDLYDNWANDFSYSPLLTIDTDGLDYVQSPAHLEQIWHTIQRQLSGRDYLKLKDGS